MKPSKKAIAASGVTLICASEAIAAKIRKLARRGKVLNSEEKECLREHIGTKTKTPTRGRKYPTWSIPR